MNVHTNTMPLEENFIPSTSISPDTETPPGHDQHTERPKELLLPTRDMSDLLRPPVNLATMRNRLFEVQHRMELKVDEFERYWPFVDNVWVRQHKAGTDKTGQFTTDYYACRLQRPTYISKKSDIIPDGKPSRKKQIREGGTCQMRLKSVRLNGGHAMYIISLLGDQTHHTHDLDHMDKIKRNTVLMEIARGEVMKGYTPGSIFTIMSENSENITAAGGRYFSRNDVRNASIQWRQVHGEGSLVHHVYECNHGNGIDGVHSTSNNSVENGNRQALNPALIEGFPLPSDTLRFSPSNNEFLKHYLPPDNLNVVEGRFPFVTLTYATSMDSFISIAPGTQTVLSGPQSKAMTHYLRSKHDAILIGVGTALADDPGLNCRLEGAGGFGGFGWEGQPRPVILDPGARWHITPQSRIIKTVIEGKGKAPWVILAPGFVMDPKRIDLLKYYGGKYLGLPTLNNSGLISWDAIFGALAAEGIKSVMVEGGGTIINELLQPVHTKFINSVIVTLAPTYLGRGGVAVCPTRNLDREGRPRPSTRFRDVRWQPLGDDVVMCGSLPDEEDHTFREPNTRFRMFA